MFYRRAKQDIDGEKMPFSNEKTMDHSQKSTFFTAMLHSKCISKMYYRRRFTFSFLSIRYTSQFGIIFALINDSPCDSVLFSTILYICMHSIRPAAYLPSAFLGARFAITFSIMTSYIYLFIYFSSSSFGAMPCQSISYSFPISIYFYGCMNVCVCMSLNWVIFSLFAPKNTRCNMRAHYPLHCHHIQFGCVFFSCVCCSVEMCAALFCCCWWNDS